MPPCAPHREPLRSTLLRTGTTALVIGGILARSRDGPSWAVATLLALWPSLGGHYVELLFLNHFRPRLPAVRAVHVAARLATWFSGGAALALGMRATAAALAPHAAHWPAWWLGGLAFIVIELIAHAALTFRRCPSFFNGRG